MEVSLEEHMNELELRTVDPSQQQPCLHRNTKRASQVVTLLVLLSSKQPLDGNVLCCMRNTFWKYDIVLFHFGLQRKSSVLKNTGAFSLSTEGLEWHFCGMVLYLRTWNPGLSSRNEKVQILNTHCTINPRLFAQRPVCMNVRSMQMPKGPSEGHKN